MIPISKPDLGKKEIDAIKKVITSGWIMNGPETEKFESEFAKFINAKYAVAVSSGTAALYLALKTLDLKKNDEVITPSYSFIASSYVINLTQAKPVFCDVEADSNMSLKNIQKKISQKTKAIIVVHQFGFPCDLDQIYAFARKNKIAVIEDAACALGSKYKGSYIGSKGKLVCFSFHPRKIITTAEGGMIVSSNRKLIERIKSLRNHGLIRTNNVDLLTELGFNLRITDIQSAIGLVQLNNLKKFLSKRNSISGFYTKSLKNNPYLDTVKLQSFSKPNWQSYPVSLKPKYLKIRDELIKILKENGIIAKEGIYPIHKHPYYKNYKAKFENSEYLEKASMLLPIYPSLTAKDQRHVIRTLNQGLFKLIK
ncbi:MAG: DegT/DnrJ/EryC1/StrS family aminotransferase [Candidatus Woesebacteria bacterium]|nr:MAG: DegT/DnrJ/EryC1/StrS family aminotransferase [Candidatus Woesebacteria bacterium]